MASLFEASNLRLEANSDRPPILDSISFCVQSGEFVALLGTSGAGKTTLLKLMNRLLSPTAGELSFQGQALETIAVRALRQQVVLVGQDSRLLGMTVRQALHYPLELQKIPLAERESRVSGWSQRLQIPSDWLPKTEMELSGGQQQQVAIARALIMQPALLLLDEPTSALDLGAATRILSVIQTLVRAGDLAVLMSNHQLDLAESFGDRVLYLEHGHLRQNQAADQVNWPQLRQKFIDADAQERQEWGDDF